MFLLLTSLEAKGWLTFAAESCLGEVTNRGCLLEGGLALGPSSLLSLMSNLDLFGDCLGEPDDEALLLVLLVKLGPSI